MRTVITADILTMARVLAALSGPERAACLAVVMEHADLAHKVSKRLGHPDPRWGDGSLTSAAGGLPRLREPLGLDPDYLESLALVAATLAWRARRDERTRKANRRKKASRLKGLPLSPPAPVC